MLNEWGMLTQKFKAKKISREQTKNKHRIFYHISMVEIVSLWMNVLMFGLKLDHLGFLENSQTSGRSCWRICADIILHMWPSWLCNQDQILNRFKDSLH